MEKHLEKLQNLVNCMMLGDKKSISAGLSHNGALLRINGIINTVRFKLDDKNIITKIITLKSDNAVVDGISVSQIAVSALHVLGVEAYIGNDEQILELIESNFEF